MRKSCAVFLLFALVLTLAGCSQAPKDRVFTRSDFSITLPEAAVDRALSDDAAAQPLLFTAGDVIITAMEIPKEGLMQLSLEEFCGMLISSNGFDTTLEETEGRYRFTYTDRGDVIMCTALETTQSFWFISATCEEAEFDSSRDRMWQYLTSVNVQ